MELKRLEEIISRFQTRRIAVVGDFFLDKYLFFDPALAEVSLETGKVANQVVDVRCSPGAAGNVVSNLAALQAQDIYAVGFAGDDGEGYELRRALTNLRCNTEGLIRNPFGFTPTYLKPQNILIPGLEGESERYDTKNRSKLPEQIESRLLEQIDSVIDKVEAVIIVDQADEPDCGVVTSGIRQHLCDLGAIHRDKVFWTDSRHRAGLFGNVILKCNASEAQKAVGNSSDQLADIGRELSHMTDRPVFVTMGERGMMVFEGEKHSLIPAVNITGPTDTTGAGDSATAGAVMALASGASLVEAALVGNLAASVTVRQLGTTGTASKEQLMEALTIWQNQNPDVRV